LLKFNLNPKQYIIAGLLVPRIGILNENHLSVNFDGVERPMVEQFIIPATWRELGIGFYGSANRLPINYSVALMNGLNSEKFEHGTGIREGRAEGSSAFANNLAVTASIQWLWKDFKFQVSGYAGGTGIAIMEQTVWASIVAHLNPIVPGEADIIWEKGFIAKLLGTHICYPEAGNVSAWRIIPLPECMERMQSWDMTGLVPATKGETHQLCQIEWLDLNSSIPSNAFIMARLNKLMSLRASAIFPYPMWL
jgi:hypothetical protein